MNKFRLQQLLLNLFNEARHGAHIIYFGAVALESHGTYGYIAGALFFMTIIAHFTGVDD